MLVQKENQLPKLDAENELEGNVGYLTWYEFNRLTRAVQTAHTHVSWWRVAGHIRSGDADEHRTRSTEQPLPLPATWLAAEEITNLLGELNVWRTLEDAVNTELGSELAMLFVREVQTAVAKWPLEDRPHKVQFFRCTACNQMTLKYHPPTIVGHQPHVLNVADTNVKCTNKECRAVMDAGMFERMALIIRAEQDEIERRKSLGDRRGGRGDNRSGAVSDLQVDPVGVGGDTPSGEVPVVVES